MNIEELGLSVRAYNAVKRYGINTTEELAERIDEFCKHAPKYGAEAREALSKVSAPQPSGVIVESAEYTRAVRLHRRICANAQAAQESLYEMCKALKEMHDQKLYRELGYSSFEDYTEKEVGIRKVQAYKYVAIGSVENVQPTEHLGAEKLFLLAKLDEQERTEIARNTDLESTSVRELKAKITELEKEKGKLIDDIKRAGDEKAGYKERQDKLLTRNKQLVSELERTENERDKLESDLDETKETVQSLEKQLEELENKPVDVYENTAKITELNQKISEMEIEHTAKIARLRSEYQSKEAGEPDVRKAVFQAYLTSAADALHRLCDFAEEHKPAEEFNYYIARINKLISHAESEATRIGGK